MKILLTGGGTGGHITPILAVAHEIKQLQPDAKLIYVGEQGGKFAHLTDGHHTIGEIHTIYSGKFRRYHGESIITKLTDLKTIALNFRDIFLVLIGLFQSAMLLIRLKPDVVFLKGGFVGVPIGLMAALFRIPFITHDSDAMPGLANRLVGRWARYHATGMPPEYYSYPRKSVKYVGVLVGEQYTLVDSQLQNSYKKDLDIPINSRVLLITGGSLGAQRVNKALTKIVPELLKKYPKLQIIHQVGKGNREVYGSYSHDRLRILEFLQGMYRYTGAADVVVTRAGANTLAELGVQGKTCIVVPNPYLTGGHQLKNTDYLLENNAVVSLSEKDIAGDAKPLFKSISELLEDREKASELAKKLHSITKPQAARELAVILLNEAKIKNNNAT